MELYYQADLPLAGNFHFAADEAQHAIKTRRQRPGDHLFVTNGQGLLAEIQLLNMDVKKCEARVIKTTLHPVTPPNFSLAISPLKHESRFEWVIEKAVEIGVHEIIPVQTSRTERFRFKAERLDRIITAAMKQSLKFHRPVLRELINFTDLIEQTEGFGYIAHCGDGQKALLNPSNIQEKGILFIGPEGDFTPEEVQQAIDKGLITIDLGPARLRTETAALVALSQAHHAFQWKNNDA
jgi:16S rRNA (uracil1498-N3)-methyltransferase